MVTRNLVSLAALAFATTPASAQEQAEQADSLGALHFLVGHCWTATFPNSTATDTHCWEDMLDGRFIRDTHVVEGQPAPYSGESIYGLSPSTGALTYTYYNSLGGISEGAVIVEEDRIVFPGERHVTAEGDEIVMRSVMTRSGEDGYTMVTERETPSGWQELWAMEFQRD